MGILQTTQIDFVGGRNPFIFAKNHGMYQNLIRPILFLFPPETIHHLSVWGLKLLGKIPFVERIIAQIYAVDHPKLKTRVFGLDFENPVGLAAGFDKNAEIYKPLSSIGFGFIEIGTVTPLPQDGNPKPRLFRLKEDQGIINQMGFNNVGVKKAVENLKKNNQNILIGGNIGKNKVTPNQDALNDYLICFEALFDVVDYFVVNLSSPNTPNLRDLLEKKPLEEILLGVKNANQKKPKPKPILLKISPDLNESQLDDILLIVEKTQIDGIIATNTTVSRENLQSENQNQKGGVSGLPLQDKSLEVIKYIAKKTKGNLPIIGVGGINDPQSALEKINAGASLIQLYTGFIYKGPKLIKDIKKQYLKSIS